MNSFINLAHLKFFCDTVDCNSMSEAALKNFITQSAISQAINKLETFFGAPLLVHNKQKLKMTEEGKIVYKQAVEIFKAVKGTLTQVHQLEKEITGHLNVASSKSLGLSFFPPTYRKMLTSFPNLDVGLKMGSRRAIRDMVRREEVDFAVVLYDHSFSQFEKHPIQKGHFNLYESAAAKDLVNQKVFIHEEKGMYVKELNEHFLNYDHTYQMKVLDSWELAAHFANLGIGIGFFPDFLASKERFANLRPHPIKLPSFEYEMAAIYNKSSRLSRAAYAFIEQFSLE